MYIAHEVQHVADFKESLNEDKTDLGPNELIETEWRQWLEEVKAIKLPHQPQGNIVFVVII